MPLFRSSHILVSVLDTQLLFFIRNNILIMKILFQTAPQVDSVKVEKTIEDSNKIAEKREVVEETSPIKESSKDDKENAVEEKEKDTTEDGEEGEEIDDDEGNQLSITTGPRALHKTFSLFMRSVPPNISKADIAAVSIYPFYLKIIQ